MAELTKTPWSREKNLTLSGYQLAYSETCLRQEAVVLVIHLYVESGLGLTNPLPDLVSMEKNCLHLLSSFIFFSSTDSSNGTYYHNNEMFPYSVEKARNWRRGRFAWSLSRGSSMKIRKTLSWQQGDGRADQFRSRSSWCSGDLRWKLDLQLWPRDQETEFPVEACWLSQTQKGQTEQILPQTFDDPFFWTALAWSTCTGFPLDRQLTRNIMLSSYGSSGKDSVGWGQHSSNRISGISTRTIHQSTTPSLSQTVWPIWTSTQFLTLPIVQSLLPVTFAYSLSSEAVVMRQLRRGKRLWRRLLTRSHKRTSMGPYRSCWNGATSALQPEESTSKGTIVSRVHYQ